MKECLLCGAKVMPVNRVCPQCGVDIDEVSNGW